MIDTLQLPYDEVVCDLDKLNCYNPGLWALSKIYTYSRQTEPFLHVDNDIFIWKGFDDNLLNTCLIAQNLEVSTEYYEGVMKSLEKNLTYLPPEIIKERKTNHLIYAYNAGILGGSDIAFFRHYAHESFCFVNRNANVLSKINTGTFNIFFEQHLFYCFAKRQNKPVTVLIQDVIGDNAYTGFDDFTEVPHNKKYLHLLGTYKHHKIVCEQMANRLRYDYPEYYYRIIALYKNKKIPLIKDYYHSSTASDEKDFVSRYNYLKDSYKNNKLKITKDNEEKKPVLKFFESQLIINLIESAQNSHANPNKKKGNSYKKQLKDVESFEKKLNALVLKKIANYSGEYLYGRDINSTAYHQYIFKDLKHAYDKKVVADK